jgi:hypothetical protein
MKSFHGVDVNMAATVDKSQQSLRAIDIEELPPKKRLDERHYNLMLAIVKAVAETAGIQKKMEIEKN